MERKMAEEIVEYNGEKGEANYLALATITAAHGSAPREAGTQMIVYPDKSIRGTVGGGPVEYQTIERAIQLIATGESKKYSYEISNEKVAQSGGICGGQVDIFIETIKVND